MTYTEIKIRNGNKYYYRAISVRKGDAISKKRVYLGKNLSAFQLMEKETKASGYLLQEKKEKTVKQIKAKIVPVLEKYNIKKAGLFGSYARGEQTKKSDIDLIIEPPKGIGFGFVRIASDLEKAARKKIDLVTYKSLNHLIKRNILREEIRIL